MEQLIDTFTHRGPGGDAAMPLCVRAALLNIAPGSTATIAQVQVTRQLNGCFDVEGDPNLHTPWVAMQSIKSLRDERREQQARRARHLRLV